MSDTSLCVNNKQLHVNTPHDCHVNLQCCLAINATNATWMCMRDLEKGGRKGKREIKTWEGGVGKQTPVSPA